MKIRAALVCLLVSTTAFADERIVTLDRTCVVIDADDGLEPPDRDHATELIKRVLERKDLLVVTGACSETYTLSHEHAGEQYVIRLRSSAGKRRMTTSELTELSAKYDRMVQSLIEAKATQAAPKPEPAPEPQATPEPQVAADNEVGPQVAAADSALEPLGTTDAETPPLQEVTTNPERSMWFAMLGAQLTGGGAVAFGYRRALATTTFEISANARDGDSAGGSIGVELLRTRQLSPSTAGYAGGGLSLGTLESGWFYGSGLQGELTSGLRFGGAKRAHALVQVDITLPFFRLGNDFGDKTYVAAAVVSGGIGW